MLLVLKVAELINNVCLSFCFQSVESGKVPRITLPVSSSEFAVRHPAARPDKLDAIMHHQSRMLKSRTESQIL